MPSKLQLLVLPLLLAVSLLAVSAAHAAPIGPAATPLAFEGEFDAGEESEEEFEFEEGECEEAEEEFEEGELSRAEVREICDEAEGKSGKTAKGSGSVAPEECILRSAHANASLLAHDSKLKLTLGYTAYEPVGAKIEVGYGSSHLASLQRHLGRSGVLRIIESLHGDNAPKQLAVRIDIPSSKSAGCPSRRLVLFPR